MGVPPTESPFAMAPADVAAVCASEGFRILQKYLADDSDQCFCSDHERITPSAKQTWILHRDIIHALIMPVVQLFNRATELAEAALCSTAPEDFEIAFREDARGAFLCLQCFLFEEADWCYTRGCPACVVLHTLSTESTIRMALTSAILSSSTSPASSSLTEASDCLKSITTQPSPTLPNLYSFLPVLKNAISSDPFWGAAFWDDLLCRAQTLEAGLHDLMAQCESLEVLVSSGPTSPTLPLTNTQPGVFLTSSDSSCMPDEHDTNTTTAGSSRGGIRLRKATLARRQQRLIREERALMLRMAWQCWGSVALPAEERMKIKEAGRRGSWTRTRSLTCP